MRDCYRVRRGQLSNGLRFYTQYDRVSSWELAVIAVLAGSFHDPPNRRGLAHLVEHVICAESEHYDLESTRLLLARTIGYPSEGSSMIATGQMVTTFGSANTIKKNHNRQLFAMLAEMISRPIIKADILASEKAVVHQEHFLNSPDYALESLFNQINQQMFPTAKTLHNSPDGLMEQVRRIRLNDVWRFINRYYTPSNAFVVFLGPRFKEVETVIAEKLGDWQSPADRPRKYLNLRDCHSRSPSFSPLAASKKKTQSFFGIKQYYTAVSFPTEPYLSKDAEALDILARILSYRMDNELRAKNKEWDKGAYILGVVAERNLINGSFTFYFATHSKEFVKEGIETFNRHCQQLCRKLVGRKELEAWVGYEFNYYFQDTFQRTPSDLVNSIITAVANGDRELIRLHDRGNQLLQLLKHNGRQKLRETARKYLSGGNITVILKPAAK